MDERILRWVPPSLGVVKLNCDAALDSHSYQGGIGIVFCNCLGYGVCCHSLSLLGEDVVLFEVQAVFHALLIAQQMGFDSMVVQTDCMVLYQCLHKDWSFGL